jgi:hypothetical protein
MIISRAMHQCGSLQISRHNDRMADGARSRHQFSTRLKAGRTGPGIGSAQRSKHASSAPLVAQCMWPKCWALLLS